MGFDACKNFADSTVAIAPSPPSSGTSLTVKAGTGGDFSAAPFNAPVAPAEAAPSSVNAEIIRVTAIAGDVFTIERAQEDTAARAILVGDQIFQGPTAKTFTDLQAAIEVAEPPPKVIKGEYTLTPEDIKRAILADATEKAFAVNVPSAVNSTGPFTVRNIATNGNAVTLTPAAGGQTIDGEAMLALGTGAPDLGATVVSDKANWHTI